MALRFTRSRSFTQGHSARLGKEWPERNEDHERGPRRAESNGGERGIRTLETLLGPTRFRVARLRPLGHLSKKLANDRSKRLDDKATEVIHANAPLRSSKAFSFARSIV